MSDLARLAPYFPKSHGKPRVDDRRVLSGIIFVIWTPRRVERFWRVRVSAAIAGAMVSADCPLSG